MSHGRSYPWAQTFRRSQRPREIKKKRVENNLAFFRQIQDTVNALAMYTQRSVYIVLYGNCIVRVVCDYAVSSLPDVLQLSALCFPDKAIVIEFIDHIAFPRPERDQSPS